MGLDHHRQVVGRCTKQVKYGVARLFGFLHLL